jgi:SAM-dependent methyltransferase
MAADSQEVDLYGRQYGNFATQLYEKIRSATYGEQIGQNGWLTVPEHDLFIDWMGADGRDERFRVLDVACGSGGPTLRIAEKTGCSVDGVDIHDQAVARAREFAQGRGLAHRAQFHRVDASGTLPFDDETFDAVICIDAINHLPHRAAVLREWHRVLTPGGMVVFTDPIVVTGPLTDHEIAVRASIGFFLFVPDGYDDAVLDNGGFALEHRLDCTDNMAEMAARFRDARAEHETNLKDIEGEETYRGQQEFFDMTFRLAHERRLSRIAYAARKR